MKKHIAILIFLNSVTTAIWSLHHARHLTPDSALKGATAENTARLESMSELKERKTQAPAEEAPTARQSQAEFKDASAPAEQKIAALENIIHMPKELGCDELLDMTQIDCLLQRSFAVLRKKYHDSGEPFLLARVITQDPKTGKFNRSYYNAHSLNRKLFGDYPITTTHNHKALYNLEAPPSAYVGLRFMGVLDTRRQEPLNTPYSNPLDRLPITRNIHYFTTDPKNPAAGFTYLCSHHQLLAEDQNETRLSQIFYANCCVDFTPTQGALKKLHDMGVTCFKNNQFHLALKYFTFLAEQSTDLKIKVSALCFLGDIYYTGNNDVQKDIPRAISYYESVASQITERITQARALRALGTIYALGAPGIEENLPRAVQYLKLANTQPIQSEDQVIALGILGAIYYTGGDGIERDFALAAKYLNQVIYSPYSNTNKAQALKILGSIYYLGGRGIDKNLKRALEYLKAARIGTSNPDDLAEIQALIKKITAWAPQCIVC